MPFVRTFIAMIRLFFFFVIGVLVLSSFAVPAPSSPTTNYRDTIPSVLLGKFTDDYGIEYVVSDSLWTQQPRSRYYILKWNLKEQYIIARNDEKNSTAAGLYTRIDYVMLPGMKPFEWGFCLSVYDAKSDSIAEHSYKADRQNPRKGCNGFPFSRMKPAQ